MAPVASSDPTSHTDPARPAISSFFKRKSPPLTSASKIGNDHADKSAVVDLTGSPPPPKRSKTTPSHDAGIATTQRSSGYFPSKSTPKPAQLTSNNIAGPSRQRLTAPVTSNVPLSSFALPHQSFNPYSTSGSAFPDYTLSAPSASIEPTSSQARQRTAEQQKRHDAWERRLNAPGGLIPRRRSLALDEGAAAEARRIANGGEEGVEGGDDGRDAEAAILLDSDEEKNKKQAQAVGNKLAAKFAVKGTGKTKTAGAKGKKKEEEIGPSGQTYTPLEKQYIEIKKIHPDVLLLMEVGYRYKFHGDDAKAAARELGIVAFPNRNFYSASVPTHRLNIHVKKLISLGYKVGVISQMETAALKKVGENRNAPFTRELTHLFTAATYVEDPSLPSSSNLTDDPILPGSAPPPTNALAAIVEMGLGGMSSDDRVKIGIVSVIPTTGDVVWDEFEDSQVRTELETRLTHLQPAELLLPAKGLSKATEKVINHFTGATRNNSSTSVRVERIDMIDTYNAAFDYLSEFYTPKSKKFTKNGSTSNKDDPIEIDGEDELEGGNINSVLDADPAVLDNNDPKSSEALDPIGLAAGLPSEEAVLALVDFPKQVTIALAIAVKYMKSFGLQNAFRHRSSFTKFINRAHMLLSSNTLNNLYEDKFSWDWDALLNRGQGDLPKPNGWGSLRELALVADLTPVLDHTKTKMGRRLMREWIGRPLLDVAALQARVDAIEEIMNNKSYHLEKMRSLLVNMPDLVRGLTRIQYGKATPTEIATILVGLNRIGCEFKPTENDVFKSTLLNSIHKALPTIRETAQEFLAAINLKQARENDEANLWSDLDKYPDLQDASDCIAVCDSELDQHLKEIKKLLKRPTLQYITVAGIEFLVEVPVRDAKLVPPKWVKINSTKSASRYHTPEILKITKEREQFKETLAAAAKRALQDFQADISEKHDLLIVARQIAVIDCLMSFAQVAAASGYCKPQFVAEPSLHIRSGRHPMVEMQRDEAYVPFDIDFSESDGSSKVITGPNMAGKSSCVRATALIVCMAQIGSFVPAASVKLGIHDAVQTRMGASDDIGQGKSTFMVELSETSDILRTLTPRTLVILDELGRGTSTYDGVAIAYATLAHVARSGANTLFVTHYPMVAEELAKEYPKQISNWHMSFDEVSMPDGSKEITFLYKLTRGLAEASFGVWCARLAGLPKTVLENAQLRADQLKVETAKKNAEALAKRTRHLLSDLSTSSLNARETIQNIQILHKSINLLA